MNSYKWVCKIRYMATIIITTPAWLLVVYFPKEESR